MLFFYDFLKILLESFCWFAAEKKTKLMLSQTKNYCWVNVSEDFKIVLEVSGNGMSYILFVNTLHLNRLPRNRFSQKVRKTLNTF